MEKLTIEEIYCLQRFGMTTQNIRKTDLSQFDKLYDDNADQFDEWLDYAEKAFDKQEELGIITISCQDSEYPKCLTDIHNVAQIIFCNAGYIYSPLIHREVSYSQPVAVFYIQHI